MACSPASILALDTAGRLDRELSTARAYAEELVESIPEDARTAFLRGAIEAATTTLRDLRRHLRDGMIQPQDVAIDVQEAALRARMNIVVCAVYSLARGQHAVPASALVGRFRSVADVTSHLANRISRIVARWHEQRVGAPQLDQAQQRSLRYASLDDAEIAFEALGRDPDLSHFLLVTIATAADLVRFACLDIAVTIGIDLGAVASEARSSSAAEAKTLRTPRYW